jgi:hypothetical protein
MWAKLWFGIACVALGCSTAANAKVITATLNELEIGIDADTGSIVSLRTAHAGEILRAPEDGAGLLDVAYPLDSFAPMRLASRFSKASVQVEANKQITITWKSLGASRPNLTLPSGVVYGQVTLRAAEDRRSVILESRIRNDSGAVVPQVLFPDLWGLRPIEGEQDTRLRLARGVVLPFAGPVTEPQKSPFYAWRGLGSGIDWKEYPAGNYYQANALRWLDFGGYRGGLSVFQKKWGSYDWPNVITRRSERDPTNLRLAWEHKQEIKPGDSWHSGEFWLTAHAGGWAKGIEVYREYVKQASPPRPMPDHVRDDAAFQTVWMIQTAEVDPAKASFRYSDLPRIAEDARKHGIREIVPWGWNTYSTLPIPIRDELGTVEDLLTGVRKSKALGVNITPFISVSILRNQYAERYSLQPSDADWSYHDELVPMFRPYYTKFWNGVEVDSNNSVWQRDVEGALREWIDRGVSSFSWDVFRIHRPTGDGRPPLLALTDRVRAHARARNPQSVFSGESATHLELDSQALDYLWNWNDYEDAAPITTVLKNPRLNCNVEGSVVVVAKCFADGMYINVMPRHPDAPNGTALISERPDLSRAVSAAAQWRKQFLPYFVEGTLIGDSVLQAPSGGFVRAHRLGSKLLVIALNDTAEPSTIEIRSQLDLWLPRSTRYQLTRYDERGVQVGSESIDSAAWSTSIPSLGSGKLVFFEITAS